MPERVGNMAAAASQTLLDALRDSFAASLRAPDGVAEPVVLIWTDADGQWKPLIPALKHAVRQVYELGRYAPDIRCGPVIWLKCIVDRTLSDEAPEPGVTPIFYLSAVSRQDLRAGGDCPRALQPLIELQYRGAVWHQRNGRDWTVEAFLTSLGLDIAQDYATRAAMLRALPLLATEPVVSLRGRRLEADDFNRLLIDDPIRDLLRWMSGPETFKQSCDRLRWATFKDVCFREFKLDPDLDGPQAVADGLLDGGGKWDEVWLRFCEVPHLYSGMLALLRQARPRDLFAFADASRRPAVNEDQENSLRQQLEALLPLSHAEACDRVIALDREHRQRRNWVWAQLGLSPYAIALEPLARLAQAAKTALGGISVETIVEDYAAQGWRCDRAAVQGMSSLKQGKEASLVARAVRALYLPWLDRSARRFQELMSAHGADIAKLTSAVMAERGTCIVFVDGLRFDLGALLQEKLEARGYRAHLTHRISPIPTVTATAKPLASPAHTACSGKPGAEDFTPVIAPSGQPVTAARLQDAMVLLGVDVLLKSDEARIATGGDGGGWTEIGKIDKRGHQESMLMIHQIEPEIDAIAERITELLASGWVRVRVVTDHGWVLVPGGLPKVDLPPYLVATKWTRCAAVQGDSATSVPTYPWYWNSLARIASPPGIAAFRANTEYSHGGVSLQECVIPELLVERGDEAIVAQISVVSWRGMRCRVTVETNASDLLVDLRLNWKLSGTSIAASAKQLPALGEASLAVSDDRHEGAAAFVVVFDGAGRVLDHKLTTVGASA
jgi:hypothetical protein